jgi:hypothetical protein
MSFRISLRNSSCPQQPSFSFQNNYSNFLHRARRGFTTGVNEGERRASRLMVSVTFLFMLFYFPLSTIRRAMPAHVPAYVQERLFWKGVFSIGFFIRNESPSSHDMCASVYASMCVW